jgi:hypothetical protein
MNCTKFVQKVGFHTALELLGEVVWEKSKLSFDKWYSFWPRNDDELALKPKLLVKMSQTASTIKHWLIVWQLASDEHSLRLLAIGKMRELVNSLTTLDQVRKAEPETFRYDFQERYKQLRAIWLQREAELATSTYEWKQVLHLAGELGDNDLKFKALTKIEQGAKTFEDWKDFYHLASADSLLEKRVLSNLARLAQSLEEWSFVWSWTRDRDRELAEQALSGMLASAFTFDEWFSVWRWSRDEDRELAEQALSWTIAHAFTFDEWFSLFAHTEKNFAIHEWCQNKLVELAKTFDNWLTLYQSAKDINIKARALNQIFELAKTDEHWRRIWYWTPEGSEAKAKAKERLLSFITLD